MTTIIFFGERADIIGPDAAVTCRRQRVATPFDVELFHLLAD